MECSTIHCYVLCSYTHIPAYVGVALNYLSTGTTYIHCITFIYMHDNELYREREYRTNKPKLKITEYRKNPKSE
jgi:hypothetical protein